MKKVNFWFSIGSTYTALTALRIEEAASVAGVDVRWHPFSVRRIMQEMGNQPFMGKPVKMRYMWRDVERRAATHGVDVNVPVSYPLGQFDRVNRVAIVASGEGWCPPFVRKFYSRWFQSSEEGGPEPVLAEVIRAVGESPERVLAVADSDATEARYLEATEAAKQRGIFGSPSFVTADGELFWGDDRLEAALEWVLTGGAGPF